MGYSSSVGNEANMKTCSKCTEAKPEDEFGYCQGKLRSQCKECMRTYGRERLRKLREFSDWPRQQDETIKYGEGYLMRLLGGLSGDHKDTNFGYYWRQQSDHFAAMEVTARTFARLAELDIDQRTNQLATSIAANARHQFVNWIDYVERQGDE